MALVRDEKKIIGGICYRPFESQEFAEIVFCAIASTEQVKVQKEIKKRGNGSHLLNNRATVLI